MVGGIGALARAITEVSGTVHATDRARLTTLRAEPEQFLLDGKVIAMSFHHIVSTCKGTQGHQ